MVDPAEFAPDLVWRRSSASGQANNACVELAATSGTVLVRDSKNRAGRILRFSRAEWREFLTGLPAGGHSGECTEA